MNSYGEPCDCACHFNRGNPHTITVDREEVICCDCTRRYTSWSGDGTTITLKGSTVVVEGLFDSITYNVIRNFGCDGKTVSFEGLRNDFWYKVSLRVA